MNEENTTIMPPEKQIVQDDRDARAEELESAFSYDGYQVVRKELFAHLRDPAIVIRKDSITFNTACITGLEDVVYVHVMFNNDLKRIVVRGCDENDKDALRWCVAKPDKRKSRKMSCKPFATLVYQEMGWDSECRYKMLGYRITFEGETLYVFDLLVPEKSDQCGSKQPIQDSRFPVDEQLVVKKQSCAAQNGDQPKADPEHGVDLAVSEQAVDHLQQCGQYGCGRGFENVAGHGIGGKEE
jgi:hypothetical protein